MENLYPPPPFQIKDGEMARFGFCAASSFIFGGRGVCCSICPRLQVGAYSRLGAYLIFRRFQQVVSLFCNKTINDNKTWRCTKPGAHNPGLLTKHNFNFSLNVQTVTCKTLRKVGLQGIISKKYFVDFNLIVSEVNFCGEGPGVGAYSRLGAY